MPKSLIRPLSFWWGLMGAMKIDFLSQLPVTIVNFYSHVTVSHCAGDITKVLTLLTSHTPCVHSGAYAVIWSRIMPALM